MPLSRLCPQLLFALAILCARPLRAQIDYEREPISYNSAEPQDRMYALQQRLESGEVLLTQDDHFGYLKSLLEHLDISPDSQTLVFSKTSFQLRKISPRRPRAVYFNDDVYVGWVRDSSVIEIAATDPVNGTMFYTLESTASGPKVARDKGQCLSCHVNYRTQGVPGLVMRSIYPSDAGRFVASAPSHTLDHNSPFEERWGGWYVTGKHGELTHLGNAVCRDKDDFETLDSSRAFNLEDLSDRIATDKYLRSGSDIVALLLLEHQTQMHNLMTRASYEARAAQHHDQMMNEILDRPAEHVSDTTRRRIASASEKLLRYMFFADAPRWADSIQGNEEFSSHFEAIGPFDAQGRGLHQLDLEQRLLKYPLSYLIHSQSFDQLPVSVKTVLGKRFRELLVDGQRQEFPSLTDDNALAISEILQECEPEFWNAFVLHVPR